MKILITGGAGFIGSAVIRHLIKNTSYSIVNVDKLTYAGNLDAIASVSESNRYSFERADICDKASLVKIFNEYQPDSVMHLAAESHVDRSIETPSDFINTNIIGTYNLLEVSRDYWQKLPINLRDGFKFHHVSTDEVYGDLASPSGFFTEKTAYDPSSPYSASKASSDHLVRAWHKTYGLPILITNCSNNYGPFHFPEKLIPLMILNALDGRDLPIYGDGKQVRDWLYVEDHARALVTVLNKGESGETYNIGGHNEKQNIEVVKSICALLQELKPQNKNYEELITFVSDRPGHDLRYAIDASKIDKKLSWQPIETFESGLRKTVQWYLDNLDWCKKIQSKYKRERLGIIRETE